RTAVESPHWAQRSEDIARLSAEVLPPSARSRLIATREGRIDWLVHRFSPGFRESTPRPIRQSKHSLWKGPATELGAYGRFVTTPLTVATAIPRFAPAAIG